jgi:hypothetical protein
VPPFAASMSEFYSSMVGGCSTKSCRLLLRRRTLRALTVVSCSIRCWQLQLCRWSPPAPHGGACISDNRKPGTSKLLQHWAARSRSCSAGRRSTTGVARGRHSGKGATRGNAPVIGQAGGTRSALEVVACLREMERRNTRKKEWRESDVRG